MKEATEEVRSTRIKAVELLGYVLLAGGVWLAWEIVKAPIVDRAPPAVALRLSPDSASALTRGAEAELAQKRYGNASDLSDMALARAPFNARALRVRGLAEAERDEDAADRILTLAGNWSLRDDPAHSWLVGHRMRRGEYWSAFAHVDTLARRRVDLHPSIFQLFNSATADSRTLAILVDLLAKNPPWRPAYFAELQKDAKDTPKLVTLAVALEGGNGRLTNAELRQLYAALAPRGQYAALDYVRQKLKRPPPSHIVDGEFGDDIDTQLLPFGWTLGGGSGVSASIVDDDLDARNLALRVQYDGFGSTPAAQQLLFLEPGRYSFVIRQRSETPTEADRLGWELRCVESAAELLPQTLGPVSTEWRRFRVEFEVSEGCTAQWLVLNTRPEARRTAIASWVDSVAINPI